MKKLKDLLKESNYLKYKEYAIQKHEGVNEDQRTAFLEAVKLYKEFANVVYKKDGLKEVYENIRHIVDVAGKMTIAETEQWFDGVTVSRHMKRMNESFKLFEKTLKEMYPLQQRLESTYDEIGEVLGKYYEINELEEGNEFGAARAKAIAAGEDEFEVDGKTFPVKSVGKDDKANAKKFAGESLKEAYNGWANWDTWNANNWLNNDESSYKTARRARNPIHLKDVFLQLFGKNHDDINVNKVDWGEIHDGLNESVNEGSLDWEKHFKGYNEKELKVISKFIFMNPQGIDGVIKMSKHKPRDFKKTIQKAAKAGLYKESINEAKYYNKADALTAYFKGKINAKELDSIARKQFKTGVATKKELSNFLSNGFTQDVMSDTYGIPKGTLVKRVRGLMKFTESINEELSQAEIDKLKKIEKELKNASDIHKAQSDALAKGSKMHASQADRINKLYEKLHKKLDLAMTQDKSGVPQGYNPMVESKTKESKVVQMIYKYEKNEKKFYDKMAEHERRIGQRDYAKFIINALRGFGINPRQYKRIPDAEEKLYQTVSKK